MRFAVGAREGQAHCLNVVATKDWLVESLFVEQTQGNIISDQIGGMLWSEAKPSSVNCIIGIFDENHPESRQIEVPFVIIRPLSLPNNLCFEPDVAPLEDEKLSVHRQRKALTRDERWVKSHGDLLLITS